MSRGFPLQPNIFMLKQISAILTRTIASVLRILQPLLFLLSHVVLFADEDRNEEYLEIHSYISVVVFCLWTEEELKNAV